MPIRRPKPALQTKPEKFAAIERRVLRALSGGKIPRAARSRLVAGLREYRWIEPEHQVVFEALTRIRSDDPAILRAQFPAQVTRMGFPDVDWRIYLGGTETSAPEVERLFRRLRARAKTPA